MIEKEISIYEPTSLMDVNLSVAIVYFKVMKLDLEPMEKIAQLIANMNNLDIADVKALPLVDLDRIGANILNLFQHNDEPHSLDAYRIIKIDGSEFGLEPDFNKMETGAYIDITALLTDVDSNLHKLMAILYRPIKARKSTNYDLEVYSTEADSSVDQRADLMLRKMPYGVVRAVVNFILANIVS